MSIRAATPAPSVTDDQRSASEKLIRSRTAVARSYTATRAKESREGFENRWMGNGHVPVLALLPAFQAPVDGDLLIGD